MEALTKMALAAVDLAEAELQSLQRGAVRLVMAIALVLGGGVLAIAGIWMLLWAGYRGLAALVGPIGALAITGAAFALVGGGLMLTAWKRITGRRTATAAGPRETSAQAAAKKADEAAARKRENEKAFMERRPPQQSPAEGPNDDPASLRIAS